MPLHILLLVNSFVTEKDPRRGEKFRLHLDAYTESSVNIGLIAIQQRDYSFFDCLRNGSTIIEDEYRKVPIIRDCTYYSVLRWVPGMNRPEIGARVAQRSVAKYIRKYGMPDVIHAHGSSWAGVTALQVLKRWGVPYIVSEHMNNYVMGNVRRDVMPLMTQVFYCASLCLPVSSTAGKAIENIIGDAFKPWEAMPNMVDTRVFNSVRQQQRSDETKVVLSISHLHEKKRLDLLLEAFAEEFAGERVVLRIGGDGPERRRLWELADRLGISSQVVFMGGLLRSEVAREMTGADVYVVSSEYETFGIPVVEAHASGLPVVTTRCGGPEDLVSDSNGIVVAVGDKRELAKAIRNVIDGTIVFDAERIATECRERYGPRAVVEKLLPLYARVEARDGGD